MTAGESLYLKCDTMVTANFEFRRLSAALAPRSPHLNCPHPCKSTLSEQPPACSVRPWCLGSPAFSKWWFATQKCVAALFWLGCGFVGCLHRNKISAALHKGVSTEWCLVKKKKSSSCPNITCHFYLKWTVHMIRQVCWRVNTEKVFPGQFCDMPLCRYFWKTTSSEKTMFDNFFQDLALPLPVFYSSI